MVGRISNMEIFLVEKLKQAPHQAILYSWSNYFYGYCTTSKQLKEFFCDAHTHLTISPLSDSLAYTSTHTFINTSTTSYKYFFQGE